jgi:PhoH-like ATPase
LETTIESQVTSLDLSKQKKFILDTNILLEDENCIEVLKNGVENKIYIPKKTIDELDGLKKNPNKRHLVLKILNKLEEYKDYINILDTGKYSNDSPDNMILNEILSLEDWKEYTFVTNDKIFALKAYKEGLDVEEYKKSNPNLSESELDSGFIDLYTEDGKRDIINLQNYKNTFHFNETGKLQFFSGKQNKILNVPDDLEYWKIKPRDIYQKALFYLLSNDDILVTSITGLSGSGKTTLSLAYALHVALQTKQYKKIIVIKSNIEASNSLGYLPGDVDDKMKPYFQNIYNTLKDLHDIRTTNTNIFTDAALENINTRKIELIPINYVRGMNFGGNGKSTLIIIDEAQNFDKNEIKTILSRCGEGSKVIMSGDPKQIDNFKNSAQNNAINWTYKYLHNHESYAHIQLLGKKSRGPICDLVNNYFN